MWVELFLSLYLSHLIADYVFQTAKSCKDKAENRWRGIHLYIHSFIVAVLAWLASFDLSFWWCALAIGISHFFVDLWKSYRKEGIEWYALDQLFHALVLAVVAYLWYGAKGWTMPSFLSLRMLVIAIAVLVCWRPANFFIKLMLKHFEVNIPDEKDSAHINAGALIGIMERWLILIFVSLGRFEALGLLVAAKSIIRFSEGQTDRTEYVLAGTLMSILIAVLCGLCIRIVS